MRRWRSSSELAPPMEGLFPGEMERGAESEPAPAAARTPQEIEPPRGEETPQEAQDHRAPREDEEPDETQNEVKAATPSDEPQPRFTESEANEPVTIDPSGFGVVEFSSDESEVEVEHDHEVKARLQDERDEEHERRREEAREHRAFEREARAPDEARRAEEEEDDDELDDEASQVEHVGGDAMEEVPYHSSRPRRQYKIQEVIKRRQVLLVQVVKEERGNKGAALTTYLSLAGRFSVLMPNTARGGGISRKITDGADRKRLKEIVHDLEVPEGMGVILRTAGATRTKAEVKRDFEYLLRLWESVRELTLRSSAPMLVYEEGSLIKRAIRDLYGQEIDEVVVSGEAAYHEAHDFMRMLMPSHARAVKLYREPAPIFAESGVEAQLDAMFSTQVTLKSGGYLVINQTEALVAIDVNSGRSTREHNIEDTALRTNLEAADEVARQLRLRDLAGLIVVDFIDMEEGRNNRAVERRIKDALKNDRARIQVGRISHFGLLEMSRQRMRAGVVEGSTAPCPHCAGAGTVRSTASIALHVLRVLEEALVRSAAHDLTLRTRTAVALYILNQKRQHLQNLEQRFGVHLTVAADDSLTGAAYHALDRGEPAFGPRVAPPRHLRVDSLSVEPLEEEILEAPTAQSDESESPPPAPREGRRHGGRGERRPFERPAPAPTAEDETEVESVAIETPVNGQVEGDEESAEAASRSRRRRRRRGRGSGYSAELAHPGADQPSDEGLAFMAHIEGAPAAVDTRRGDRRGRARGPGRWTRSSPLPAELRDPHSEEIEALSPVLEEDAPPSDLAPAPQTAHDAEGQQEREAVSSAEPLALTPILHRPAPQFEPSPPHEEAAAMEATTPESAETPAVVAEAAPQPAPEPEPASEPEPPREPTEVVITKADPAQPKRGGWWQRVKSGSSGG